jgi:hypothetical protein
VTVHVLVPADTGHNLVDTLDEMAAGNLRAAVDSDDAAPEQARATATTALTASLDTLRAAGLTADGGLTADDPVPDVLDAARRLDADEVVVVTEQHLVGEMLRRDWSSRIRHQLERPVLHVVAGTDRIVS